MLPTEIQFAASSHTELLWVLPLCTSHIHIGDPDKEMSQTSSPALWQSVASPLSQGPFLAQPAQGEDAALQSRSISTVAIKLPQYWAAQPSLWFAQVEAQFILRGITQDSTKYHHVVAALSPEAALDVSDILTRPPTANKYTKLKAVLVDRSSASTHQRLHQLIATEELGDRKPSQLLRAMRRLLGPDHMDDSLLRELFLQRLPTHTQMVLAASTADVPLDDLADMADRVMDVAPTVPRLVAAAATSPAVQVEQLREEMAALRSEVRWLNRASSHSPVKHSTQDLGRHSPTPSRPRATPHMRGHDGASSHDELCWYHTKFGSRARTCRKPCSFHQGN